MAKITITHKKLTEDKLRINLNSGKIKLSSHLFKYRDKDTRQVVVYIPSLDITGYGATDKKAMEMINFAISNFFDWLTKLPHKQIDIELKKLGWEHVQYKSKEYSKSFVDEGGLLHSFNAVGDEVERLTIEA